MKTKSGTSFDQDHRRSIQEMFVLVAPRYDLMNDLMSFGTHRLWKNRFVGFADVKAGTAIDLAGGTGDIAKRLIDKGWTVTVCDPSEDMMKAGQARGIAVDAWVSAAGEDLPFADNSIDLITISFGLRNMTDPDAALREMLRVLKPGGRMLCLEFSKAAPWLRPFYDWYSRHIIPRLGAMVAGRREAYQYLVNSIRAFPDQETLKARLEQTGFENVHYKNVSFGIAAIHQGAKPS